MPLIINSNGKSQCFSKSAYALHMMLLEYDNSLEGLNEPYTEESAKKALDKLSATWGDDDI